MFASEIKKGDSHFPMTTFRCKKKVIPKLTLVIASFTGLSTTLAADESLEEIIVSGVKDPRSGSLISSGSSRLVSPSDVVTPVFSTGELVARLAGASRNGQGGLFQSYSLRGFSRSRIRTEISGVPIISDRRAGNSLSFLPETFIENIRADMGPASSLYGSGAMGGVLSASLREPQQTALNFRLGSAGNYHGIGLETRLNDQTAIAASFKSTSNSRAADNEPLNTAFRQSALYARNIQTVRELLISSEFIAGVGHDLGKSSKRFPADRISTYPHDEHLIINLRATNQRGLFAQAYVHEQDWASQTERIGDRQNVSRYQSQTYGALVSRQKTDGTSTNRLGIELTARTNIDIAELETPLDGDATAVGLVSGGNERFSGIFTDRIWFLGDSTLRVGGRLDRSKVSNDGSSRSKTQLNGQIQIDTILPSDWLLAAELGTAYRLPTLSELYFSGETPRGTVQGNSLLAPEETIGSQVTLSRQSDNLVFELSSFYNRVEGYIERVRAEDGSLTYQNLRSGRIWGFDGQLSIESAHQIKHRIAWQWQRGEADDGEFLDDLPPPEVSYKGTWRSGTLSVGVDLGYRFKRSDHGPSEIPLGSSLIGGARIAWNLNQHWSASLAVSNAFDRTYRNSADEDSPLANERAAHLTLRWAP